MDRVTPPHHAHFLPPAHLASGPPKFLLSHLPVFEGQKEAREYHWNRKLASQELAPGGPRYARPLSM